MKKYKRGYTTGTFDLLHIGHLNFLKAAKELCEYLIVDIVSDSLVSSYKTPPLMTDEERMEIIKSIKYVDEVGLLSDIDKHRAWEKFRFDIVFIGSDWKNTDRWNKHEMDLNALGVDVIYLPYTNGISSTLLKEKLKSNKE